MATPLQGMGPYGRAEGPQSTGRANLGSTEHLFGNQSNFGIPNHPSSPQMTPEQRAALEQHLSQASSKRSISPLEIGCLAIMTVTLPFALLLGGSLMITGGGLGAVSTTLKMITDFKTSPQQKIEQAKERIIFTANPGTKMVKGLKEPLGLTLQYYIGTFDNIKKKPWQ